MDKNFLLHCAKYMNEDFVCQEDCARCKIRVRCRLSRQGDHRPEKARILKKQQSPEGYPSGDRNKLIKPLTLLKDDGQLVDDKIVIADLVAFACALEVFTREEISKTQHIRQVIGNFVSCG
jgi:hypothetical protein